ncbi:MAG TPA: DEAD/DEAH box helicase [Kiritimatiellia bacterium]|nr:DEAD/DEAH box helicase [Kiritimatiellia bacterium]
MPLGLLKKLAGKLLGSAPAAKKTEPAKGKAGSARDRAATPQRGKGQSGAAAPGRSAPPEGGRRPDRPPRGEGGRRRGPGAGGGPRGDAPRSRREEPRGERKGGPAATAPSARAVARPNAKERRGRDAERGGRMNTDPKARRPGGALAEADVAQRLAEHAAWTLDQYPVEPAEGKKRFHDFDLPSELLHAVCDMGFKYCTPIQALSLEHALAGKNVAGKAQTGTGKTAAFLVAILTRYLRTPEARHEKGGAPRALVIAPTRELVIQICKDAANIGKYCNLRSLAVYGGMDYERQKREVTDAPVDLLVATPGRLLDFVRSRVVDLSKVDTLVIDEADRMLDMGFIPDVRSIVNRLPPKEKRSTMLYSATLDDAVMRLASQWMEAPVKVEVESEHVTTKTVKQIVYVVTASEKFTVLYNLIQQYPDSRMLIFCNRRNTTEDVAESLAHRGIRCEMLSGDVNQNRRLRVLEDFREGKIRTVVATDVAGRGLHVDDIGFVVNFDFPYEPEDYVHRIGRTGRAGHTGTAISFADEDESFIIPDIEKFIGEELKCTVLHSDDALLAKLPPKPPRREGGGVCAERPRRDPPRDARRHEPAPASRQPRQEDAAAPRDTAGTVQRTVAERTPKAEQPEPKQAEPEPAAAPSRDVPAKPAAQSREVMPAAASAPAARRSSVAAPAQPAAAVPRRVARFSEEWVPGEK